MYSAKRFKHECDESTLRPIKNYAVIYDNEPKRSSCFGNALIDEQVILSATSDRVVDAEYIAEVADGCDNVYPSAVVYFIPAHEAVRAKSVLNEMVNKWLDGQDSGIGYSDTGDIYIALRTTSSGLWILTYDGTSFVAFEDALDVFDAHFSVVNSYRSKNLSLENPFVAHNADESAGEEFFTFFKRKKPLFALMQQEGLYDDACRRKYRRPE